MELPASKFNIATFPSGAKFPAPFLNIYDKIAKSIAGLRDKPENQVYYEEHFRQSSLSFEKSLSIAPKGNILILGSENLIDIPIKKYFHGLIKLHFRTYP